MLMLRPDTRYARDISLWSIGHLMQHRRSSEALEMASSQNAWRWMARARILEAIVEP